MHATQKQEMNHPLRVAVGRTNRRYRYDPYKAECPYLPAVCDDTESDTPYASVFARRAAPQFTPTPCSTRSSAFTPPHHSSDSGDSNPETVRSDVSAVSNPYMERALVSKLITSTQDFRAGTSFAPSDPSSSCGPSIPSDAAMLPSFGAWPGLPVTPSRVQEVMSHIPHNLSMTGRSSLLPTMDIQSVSQTLPPTEDEQDCPASHGYALVQFKCTSSTFRADIAVSVGQHVVVEGDRGTDVGKVIAVSAVSQGTTTLRVLRVATQVEVDKMESLRKREEQVLYVARTHSTKLQMKITVQDAAFQHDEEKLTIYYSTAHAFVDFRQFQRRMHRKFKCRIWMAGGMNHQLDNKTEHSFSCSSSSMCPTSPPQSRRNVDSDCATFTAPGTKANDLFDAEERKLQESVRAIIYGNSH